MSSSVKYIPIVNNNLYPRKYTLILAFIFVIWPFGAFILSLLTFNLKISRIIFVLFWGIWGYSRNLIWGHDSTDWTLEFVSFSNLEFNEFITSHILTLGIDSTDFLISLLSFSISRITQNTAMFWFIHGLLFSYLYVKCYPTLLKDQYHKKLGLFALFIIFFLFIPRTAYGVRFWYAALIYIYSIIKIILYNEKKYRILLFLAPLIHFSFIILVFSYIYYDLTNKNKKIFLTIWFTLAICFNLIGFSNLIGFVENFPIFGRKIESYGNIQSRGEYFAEKSIFFMLDKYLYTFYSVFIVLLFRIKSNLTTLSINEQLRKFNYFLMIFLGTLIFLSDFLDALDRFSIIFTLLTILYFTHIYVFNKNSILVVKLTFFSLLFWGIHLIVNYLRSSSSMNSTLWYNSLWGLISGNQDLPILF